MMALACMAILAILLLIGAAIDIKCRRLPNWLTASVAGLYAVYVIVAPYQVDWVSALTIAGASFTIGFALFAFNLLGGGDVKLIAALTLWSGVDLAALFLLITGLAGGLMSLGILLRRRLANHPILIAFWPFLTVVLANRLGFALPFRHWEASARSSGDDLATASLPYGVAIAAGGLTVIYALLKL